MWFKRSDKIANSKMWSPQRTISVVRTYVQAITTPLLEFQITAKGTLDGLLTFNTDSPFSVTLQVIFHAATVNDANYLLWHPLLWKCITLFIALFVWLFFSFLQHAKFSPFCFMRKNDVHCTKNYYHQFTQWLFFPTTPKRRLVCPSFYFWVLGCCNSAKSSHTFSPTATLSASLIKSLSLVLTKPIYFLYLRSYLYIT